MQGQGHWDAREVLLSVQQIRDNEVSAIHQTWLQAEASLCSNPYASGSLQNWDKVGTKKPWWFKVSAIMVTGHTQAHKVGASKVFQQVGPTGQVIEGLTPKYKQKMRWNYFLA